MKTVKRYSSLLFILLLCSFSVSAQKAMEEDTHFSIKLGYSMLNSTSEKYQSITTDGIKSRSHFRLDATYNLTRCFEAGVYIGYSQLLYPYLSNKDGGLSQISYKLANSNDFFYGLNFNFQLLPLFTKTKSPLDVYATARLGLVSTRWTNPEVKKSYFSQPFFEYGGGLGVAYRFTPNIGVFAECTYGRFFHDGNLQPRGGIIVKF